VLIIKERRFREHQGNPAVVETGWPDKINCIILLSAERSIFRVSGKSCGFAEPEPPERAAKQLPFVKRRACVPHAPLLF